MTAAEALSIALLELAEQGHATPCQGRRRDRWTSESAEDRGWAASVCVTLACPVLEECAAAAAERKESFAVWGGVDYTLPRAAPHEQGRRAASSSSRAAATSSERRAASDEQPRATKEGVMTRPRPRGLTNKVAPCGEQGNGPVPPEPTSTAATPLAQSRFFTVTAAT